MSGFLVAALKIGFLLLLWVFIFFLGTVIKTDLFGQAVSSSRPSHRRRRRRKRDEPTHLAITSGATQGSSFDLTSTPLLVGRGSDCAVVLDDDYSSTRHARIAPSDDGWFVEDLGSTNGTYVNGQRVTSPTLITPDDVVRIGRTTMKLEG